MELHRAKENEKEYLKYEKSFIHNTALIAKKNDKVLGVLEYEISNMVDTEIVNFKSFDSVNENEIFQNLIDELMYWNPYVKRIFYNEDNNMITHKTLIYSAFKKSDKWILHSVNDIEIFKIDINKITPEQLTVDREKVERADSWIEKPEDIIVTCVKIDDTIVTIDGYSRLVVALNKGFDYVYAHFDPNNTSLGFYKTCIKWCEEAGVYTIKDLTSRVVSPEEHQTLWCNRCQAYLKMERDTIV